MQQYKDILSTDDVHRRDRVNFWRDAVQTSFVELECGPICAPADFYGKITNRPFASGQLSEVVSHAQHVNRSLRCIKRSDSDTFLLSLQMNGHGVVSQHSRDAFLMPGSFALYDTTQPYQLHFDNVFSQIVIRIPRHMALRYMPEIERLTAYPIDRNSSYARIFAAYLAEIYGNPDDMMLQQDENLLRSLLHLLSVVYHSVENDIKPISTTRYVQLSRIKEYIFDHLGECDLNLQHIAEAHNISTRYLSELFKAEDCSPGRWLWTQRLERSCRLLASPQYINRTISEIAYACGFNDMSHFSRAFKKHYGVSPRQFRHSQLSQLSASSAATPRRHDS